MILLYEPGPVGLCVQGIYRLHADFPTPPKTPPKMAPTTPPPLDFEHKKGYEIPTKHKEAIRQLHNFSGIGTQALAGRYHLGESTIRRILSYDKPERARLGRTGPKKKLSNSRIREIIKYVSEKWDQRVLKYEDIVRELDLPVTAKTLQMRLY